MLKVPGECLWGPQYRSEAARQLDVHLRTVMRWDSGETAIPQSAWDRLYDLMIKRQAEVSKLVAKLGEARKVSP